MHLVTTIFLLLRMFQKHRERDGDQNHDLFHDLKSLAKMLKEWALDR